MSTVLRNCGRCAPASPVTAATRKRAPMAIRVARFTSGSRLAAGRCAPHGNSIAGRRDLDLFRWNQRLGAPVHDLVLGGQLACELQQRLLNGGFGEERDMLAAGGPG